MEAIVVAIFAATLLGCILAGFSLILPLTIGFFLFCGYSLMKGHSVLDTLKMAWTGLKTSKNILIVFVLIGMITAVWRASGTIAFIIYGSSPFIIPSVFLLVAFALNAVMSFLTGTSFGTSATMGVITMTIGLVMGLEPALLGGCILSGIYVGDRCSPMSTSALLITELTGTNIYDNIVLMMKTSIVPLSLTAIIYTVLGFTGNGGAASLEVLSLFSENFNLHWVTILPAIIILVLSCFRVNVKITMLTSIVAAVFICVLVQGVSINDLLHTLVFGFTAQDVQLGEMMNGGGITSMITVAFVVGLSSCYSGIFNGTGMLNQLKDGIHRMANHITPYGGVIVTAIVTGLVACNQTLTIILTNELCKDTVEDKSDMAIYLENGPIVIAPLIPWSIAGAVPLATVGAPTISILFACYLYLLPLWNILVVARKRTKSA